MPFEYCVNELTENSDKSIQPEKIKIKLKSHQLSVLNYAEKLEHNRVHTINESLKINSNIGILGDKVGSGKTHEMLSIIASSIKLDNFNDYISSSITSQINLLYKFSEYNNYTFFPVNIIVVPHTIFKQWEYTIKTETMLTFYSINNKKTLTFLSDNFESCFNKDIILVSSTKYRDFYDIYKHKNVIVSRLVFDECNMIKISKLIEVKASFYWFMTSSIDSLHNPRGLHYYQHITTGENIRVTDYNYSLIHLYKTLYIEGIKNTGFIFDTFDKINKFSNSIINDYKSKYEIYCDKIKYNQIIYIKNNDDYIKQSFSLPEPEISVFILNNPILFKMLSTIVSTQIINMINAGDVKSAINSFNCNKTTSNNLIQTVTDTLRNELHNIMIEKQMKEKMIYSNQTNKIKAIQKLDESIDKIKSKIKLLTERINENSICPICFDSIKNKTLLNCCHNSFCFECITMWLCDKTNCPHCRKKINNDNIIVVTDKDSQQTKKIETKISKMESIIKKRLEENPNFKLLIFSEYNNTFNEISVLLEKLSIKFKQVKGQINKTLDDYKNGNLNCLLLNTCFFGNGLNLENTDDIILYHNLNKEMTEQVIGRAQRPGRKTPLKIWKLRYENE